MIESALLWMNERHPDGFFCCDLNQLSFFDIPWIEIVALNRPLLIHLQASRLQDLITSLIDAGASPATPCTTIPKLVISGTLGDIAMKVRAAGLNQLDLVVHA